MWAPLILDYLVQTIICRNKNTRSNFDFGFQCFMPDMLEGTELSCFSHDLQNILD